MAKLLPFRDPERAKRPRRPRLIELSDDTADEVFAALSSETARAILRELYSEPAPASEIAEGVDTSLQNARYHLENLLDAGLVEEVDTWYSSRGTEMTVYAPTNEPLVVAAGPEESTTVLHDAVKRLVGAIGLLAGASVLIEYYADVVGTRWFGAEPGADRGGGPDAPTEPPAGDGGAGGGDVGIASTPSPTNETANLSPTPQPTTIEAATVPPTSTPVSAFEQGPDVIAAIPPGLAFFLGGLSIIALVAIWWYWRRYRPLYGAT